MTEFVLQTIGLVRRIEGVVSYTLVNGIDLSVRKGEFLAITGPSGSGKSSLLYFLGLLDAPTEGEVNICGQPTSNISETERADLRLTKCGFVFQFHFLLPEFTALENVLLPMRELGRLGADEMRTKAVEKIDVRRHHVCSRASSIARRMRSAAFSPFDDVANVAGLGSELVV